MTELTLQIIPDMDPMSPREWSNVGTMVCAHRSYTLGDEQTDDAQEYIAQLVEEKEDGFLEELDEWLEEQTRDIEDPQEYHRQQAKLAEEKIQEAFEKYYISLPLYLYDHSGITMSTGSFSCPWDSGQVGIIYVSRERAAEEYGAHEFPLTREVLVDPEGLLRGQQGKTWQREFQSLDELTEYYLKGEVEVYDQYLCGDVWGFVLVDEDGEELDSCWGFYGDDYRTNGILDHISSEDEAKITKVQYMEPTMTHSMQVRDEEEFTQ